MFNIVTGDKSGGKIINTIMILHIKHTQSHRCTDHHRDSPKHSHSQSHTHTHTHTYTVTHTHTHTHIQSQTHTHTYTVTDTHTHTHTHTHICLSLIEANDKTQLQRYEY